MIHTARLLLRPWRESDVASFHAMGQDAEVMRYLGPSPDLAACTASIRRMQQSQHAHGFCFWALERSVDGAFVGFCGLKHGAEGTPIADSIEIGWRLARSAWGQGLATEAARASLAWGWANLDVAAVEAITVAANAASRRLMERVGMTRQADGDFDHPAFPTGHPLSRHVRYRIQRPSAA